MRGRNPIAILPEFSGESFEVVPVMCSRYFNIHMTCRGLEDYILGDIEIHFVDSEHGASSAWTHSESSQKFGNWREALTALRRAMDEKVREEIAWRRNCRGEMERVADVPGQQVLQGVA